MDAVIPPEKVDIIAEADKKVQDIRRQYDRGFISDDVRYERVVKTWNDATQKVRDALQETFKGDNPIYMMADSGARGSMDQIRQLAGMRGLIANTSGRSIEIPIKSNYREGLNILEYFNSSRGARKGLADTALRTADSGYLTRSTGRCFPGCYHPHEGLRYPRRYHGTVHHGQRPCDRGSRRASGSAGTCLMTSTIPKPASCWYPAIR